jgi:predicted PurR-regulated permease PerM
MLGIDARAARYTWTAALVLLLLCLVYLMRTTLFVFIVALLFGYLLSPLVNVIDRLLPASRTRTPALAVAYLIFVTASLFAVTQIGSRVVMEANSLRASLPASLDKWQHAASPVTNSIIQWVRDQIGKSSGDIIASLPRAGAKILSVASDLVYIVIVPILGFFFLKDGRIIAGQFVELIEEGPWRTLVDDLLADADLLLARYMRALLLLSLATFTCYSIFFSILRVPYSLLLAALAGTLELIPMIGSLTAGLMIVIVTWVSGGPVLGALAFLLIYRLFQDYILSPRLMSAGVELHPLIVLFGVFAGAEIAGIPGAFLSVPVLALIRILARRIRRVRAAMRLAAVQPVRTP